MQYTIYINETRFTADENTIEEVEQALKAAGFQFNPITEGWESVTFQQFIGEPIIPPASSD